MIVRLIIFLPALLSATAAGCGESPRDIIEAAIKAHGGEERIAKTIVGKSRADVKINFPPGVESSATLEDAFELPRRYKRVIKGKANGEAFTMEYAIIDGRAWIRHNEGMPSDFKGDPQHLSRNWNATIAMLPTYLKEAVKLEPGGKEQLADRELVGVRVTDKDGEAILFFDRQSRLLSKMKWQIQDLESGEKMDMEGIFADYKEVAGVRYPMRMTSYSGGKEVAGLKITHIEFVDKLDDRLFERPLPQDCP
jgi:hypothetical protein